MTRTTRRAVIGELVKLAPAEQQFVLARLRGTVLAVRVFPGPAPTPAYVYARIRYEQTGQRQWIFAPGMTRRWPDA